PALCRPPPVHLGSRSPEGPAGLLRLGGVGPGAPPRVLAVHPAAPSPAPAGGQAPPPDARLPPGRDAEPPGPAEARRAGGCGRGRPLPPPALGARFLPFPAPPERP